ncbi:MAG: hypothetical protein JNM52_02935, partial [Betaproteobacteria bacterium]|nr:hypothetical protein [Betaproteobacteria bacterium]
LVVQLAGAERLFGNVDRLINEFRQASAKPAAPAAPAKTAPAKAAPAKAAPAEKK